MEANMANQNIDSESTPSDLKKSQCSKAQVSASKCRRSRSPYISVGDNRAEPYIPPIYRKEAEAIKCKSIRRRAFANLKRHFAAFETLKEEEARKPNRYLVLKFSPAALGMCKGAGPTLAQWMGRHVLQPLQRWLADRGVPFIGHWVIELDGGPHINIVFRLPRTRGLEDALAVELLRRFWPNAPQCLNLTPKQLIRQKEENTPVCLQLITRRPSKAGGRWGHQGLAHYIAKEIVSIATRQERRTSWNVGKQVGFLNGRRAPRRRKNTSRQVELNLRVAFRSLGNSQATNLNEGGSHE